MKIVKRLLVILLVIVCLTGCATSKTYTAYTVYPVGYLLNRIGGNKISPISIQNNTLVQVANMKDDYKETLENSLVLFKIGDLEPYFDLYEEEIKETGVNVVDLSTLNALYEFKRYTLVMVEGKENYVESEWYEGEAFKHVDMHDLDLSIWLDPIGMLSMANDVREYLASNYIEESDFFNSNFKTLSDDLISLDASYQALSTKLKKENKTIKFVSLSPNFTSWQKAYGFQVYPVCLSKYGATPSDSELEIIKERIAKDNVKYIAYEPNLPQDMMDIFVYLEDTLGLKRINLNNISSLTENQVSSGKDYLSLMYENLSVLENIAVEG